MRSSRLALALLLIGLLALRPPLALSSTSSSPMISAVQLGTVPRGVAVDSNSGLIYALMFLNGTTLVINSDTLGTVAKIPTPSPYAVAVDQQTGGAYVSQGQGASIVYISASTHSVVTSIDGAGTPYAVAVDQDNDVVAAADTSENTLYIVNGSAGTVIGHVRMGSTSALAVDPATDEAYIGNLSSTGDGGTVEAVSLQNATVLKTASIPISPDHFAIDTTDNLLVVTSETTSNGANFAVLDDRSLSVMYSSDIGHALGVVASGPPTDFFVADLGINRLYEVTVNGDVLLNSTGNGQNVSFTGITSMAYDYDNDNLYVTENEVTNLIVVSPAATSSSSSTALSPAYLGVLALSAVIAASVLAVRQTKRSRGRSTIDPFP